MEPVGLAISVLGIAFSFAMLVGGAVGIYRIVVDRRMAVLEHGLIAIVALLTFPIGGLVWLAAGDSIVERLRRQTLIAALERR